MHYQLPRPAIKACEVGLLHAGVGISCRPHPAAATQLVIISAVATDLCVCIRGCRYMGADRVTRSS